MNKAERDSRWADGTAYNEYVNGEFNSFRKNAWKIQVGKHLKDSNLSILDLGTGPGFFACILSEMGHRVTAIDSSDGMLKHAQANAERLGVHPEFIKMDINNLDFESETFDVIITRNVTWTLEHPVKVYMELKRLLKPNGILLIYDANWMKHLYDEELYKKVREHEEEHKEKYGEERTVAHNDMEYLETTPLVREDRPYWDIDTLRRMDMDVNVEFDISDNVYEDWEKDLYREHPFFEICARKLTLEELQRNMKDYWNYRSASFGFPYKELDKIKSTVVRYLPKTSIDVLDVGTGTGIIATVMSSLGHNVTAVDIAENMLIKAEENLHSLGLEAEFKLTDGINLPFEDNSFDCICSRNLLWAFPDPVKVLNEWKRVLRPDGILMYFDGNHYYYLFNEEDAKNREIVIHYNGRSHEERGKGKIDYSLCDNTAVDLPLSRLNRPYEWDDIVLPQNGFAIYAEEINKPQSLINLGIIEKSQGFYTSFFIVAKNKK